MFCLFPLFYLVEIRHQHLVSRRNPAPLVVRLAKEQPNGGCTAAVSCCFCEKAARSAKVAFDPRFKPVPSLLFSRCRIASFAKPPWRK